ncbi:MAG: membrane protein insertion efficiency factor YidD [Treponema sp.]|nr:membrane protein insertion efficiency factor YidD [Treponema sp.]
MIPQTIILMLIRFYQKAVSPYFLPHCRYYPSCSAYASEAVRKYGAIKGSFWALKRLLRCHPLHQGGYDPVPGDCPALDTEKKDLQRWKNER